MSLYRNFLSVGGLTLLSRFAGFVRDALMAAVLGIGPVSDAFNAAFRFPNLFRRLFAEGAFNTAFVPTFAAAMESKGPVYAQGLAGRIMGWLISVIVVVTIAAEIFMPQLMSLFVVGFAEDPQKFELTVFLARIMFPYLACMSLMAAYSAVLNAVGRYFAAAFAPVLLNIVNISVLVPLAIWTLHNPADVAFWMAIAAMAGGVAQLVLVYASVRRSGYMPVPSWPRLDPEISGFWGLAIPAVIAGGITQINIFVGTVIASGASDVISVVSNADRLYQLPLGVIGIAIGTILLPELSRHLSAGRFVEASSAQNQSLLLAMVLSMPAAAALIVIPTPIVRVLFERGLFDAIATQRVSEALLAFAFGLPAFVLIRVLQPAYFARKQIFLPMVFAAVSVVFNIAISLLLFQELKHVAIALATSISAWVNVLMLVLFSIRHNYLQLGPRDLRRHLLVVASSGMMGLALAVFYNRGEHLFQPGVAFSIQLAALCGICLFGGLFYFSFVNFAGVFPIAKFLKRHDTSRSSTE